MLNTRQPDWTEQDVLDLGYVAARELPDGEWMGVLEMTYGKGRLCLGLTPGGHEQSYCYESLLGAIVAMHSWNPETEPEPDGWFRDPLSGRRRPDGDKTKEYVAR